MVRVSGLLPLAVFAALYAALPELRQCIDEGVAHLWKRDVQGLRDWGARLGPWAPLATTALMVFQAIAAPVPAVLVTAANSLLFGPLAGGLLSIGSATLAALICYLLARAFGERVVEKVVPRARLAAADRWMALHGSTAVLVARLIPFVPFDPVSFLAGLARLPIGGFLLATFVGQIPAGFAYSYLAQEIDRPSRLAAAAAAVVLGLLILGLGLRRLLLKKEPRGSPPSE
jgi:uncharacterized membrane protein YdjX (TVP38/TMEM64 family)